MNLPDPRVYLAPKGIALRPSCPLMLPKLTPQPIPSFPLPLLFIGKQDRQYDDETNHKGCANEMTPSCTVIGRWLEVRPGHSSYIIISEIPSSIILFSSVVPIVSLAFYFIATTWLDLSDSTWPCLRIVNSSATPLVIIFDVQIYHVPFLIDLVKFVPCITDESEPSIDVGYASGGSGSSSPCPAAGTVQTHTQSMPFVYYIVVPPGFRLEFDPVEQQHVEPHIPAVLTPQPAPLETIECAAPTAAVNPVALQRRLIKWSLPPPPVHAANLPGWTPMP